jgi:uncharacterized iron-regulated membrane protein
VTPAEAGRHRALWRWHFYAGLFCAPFVLWLAVTGSLYLWKPQIETWIDRPYANLPVTAVAPPSRLAAAAVAAVPGSAFKAYQLPVRENDAAQVQVMKDGETIRVYVHPESGRAMKVVAEKDRFFRWIFRLHGELILGSAGSFLVELAASWAVVMILTGLFLWWPRGRGPAGVLWPRIGARGRILWRDLHAVTGMWVSIFALFLLVTGMPWASNWGALFKQARALTGTAAVQDWPGGGEHAEHGAHAGHHMAGPALRQLDIVTLAARQLALAPPVLLSPGEGGGWTVKSDAANRPLRKTLTLDGATGAVRDREDFADRHVIDRVVGYGIAAHEGQLFGIANQLLGMATALGLMLLTVSAYVMWWRRRPPGSIGGPWRHHDDRLPKPAVAVGVVLGLLLPLFGATALLAAAVDRWGRVRCPKPAHPE